MIVLGVDTAFSACNLAVVDASTGTTRARATHKTERGQAEILVPMIDDVLKQAGVTYADLGLVGVTIGPGSFTGIRIGLAAAIGVALARNIPAQGVVTTDALYTTWADQHGDVPAQVMIDTKRGDVFYAHYAGVRDVPCARAQIKILSPDDARACAGNVPVIGDGYALAGEPEPDITLPGPDAVAKLAARFYDDKSYEFSRNAAPFYMREAEISIPKLARL